MSDKQTGVEDARTLIARKRLGMGDDWRPYRWEALDDGGILITGAVVKRKITRGPRKGAWDWKSAEKGTDRRVVISAADEAAWEAETGICARCSGSGKVFYSWHHETGTTYRECPSCAGSGMAKRHAEGGSP